MYVPPTRTVGAHEVRPPSVGLAERRGPLDARGGSRPFSRRQDACRASRPRHRRRLVEARQVPSGSPGCVSCVALSLGGESGELWKAVRPVFRRGVGRGARDLRPPGGSACDPFEVHLGRSVPRTEPRAARRLCDRRRQWRRRPCTSGFHLKPLDIRLLEVLVPIMRPAQPNPDPTPKATVSVDRSRLGFGHAMTFRSHERLPYMPVRMTTGHASCSRESTNVLPKPGLVLRDLMWVGHPRYHLKSGGNRSGIPSLISYRWLQCLQNSEPSRISSFSTSTWSSRSPLQTGQHRISMRSRFIARGKVRVRLKPIARSNVRGPFQKPLGGASHPEECAFREFPTMPI